MSLDDLCRDYLDACKKAKHYEALRERLRQDILYSVLVHDKSTSAASIRISNRIKFFIPLEPLRSERPDIFTLYALSRSEHIVRVRHPDFPEREEEVNDQEAPTNE